MSNIDVSDTIKQIVSYCFADDPYLDLIFSLHIKIVLEKKRINMDISSFHHTFLKCYSDKNDLICIMNILIDEINISPVLKKIEFFIGLLDGELSKKVFNDNTLKFYFRKSSSNFLFFRKISNNIPIDNVSGEMVQFKYFIRTYIVPFFVDKLFYELRIPLITLHEYINNIDENSCVLKYLGNEMIIREICTF